MNVGAIEPDYLALVMPSINKPFLFALRCIAVIICCLPLFPTRTELAGPVFADSSRSADSVAFAAAAEQNARLKFDLIWTFGAKSQRGWRLYTPLIQRLLNTDAAPATTAFAQALADWQRSAGLASTGVLDQET